MLYKRFTRIAALALILAVSTVTSMAQAPACHSLDLVVASSFDAGANVSASVMADFNMDGKKDIAVVNAEQQRAISILNGDGYGGFAPPKRYPTASTVSTLAQVDVNNDSKIDIVAAGASQNQIFTFINTGTAFQTPITVTTPNNADFVDLRGGDFNGDGHQDIAAIRNQFERQLHIFLGNGQGSFTFASSMNLTSRESVMEIGNLNGDGFADIIVSGGDSFTPRYISFVYGNAAGTFSATFGFNVLEKPVAFSIARLNSDSANDFVTAFEDTTTPTQPYVRPFLAALGGGSFTPGAPIEPPYFLSPTDVVTGDFDGDGDQDIAAPLSGQTVLVAYGRGDGQFSDVGYWAVAAGSRSIFSDDLNGDSRLDIAMIQQQFTLSNSLSVLTNLGNQRFRAPKAVLWGLSEISAADFNNDGMLDFASSRKSSFGSVSSVEVNLNGVNGLGPDLGVPTPRALTAMSVGDFNGDGFKDAITSHSNNDRAIAVYLGNGTGNLAAPVLTSINQPFENLMVGRFNSDALDDVFVVDGSSRGYSMLSNGNGTFTAAPNFPVTLQSSVVKLAKGDFNEDGNLDLIIGANPVHLWLGDGTGQFTRSMTTTIPTLSDVVAGDFNGDGHQDLAGFDINSTVKGVLGLGNGEFGQTFSATVQGPSERRSLVSGDFDLDGRSDVAFLLQLSETKNLVILSSSSESPGWRTPVLYSIGGLSGYTASLFAADYNADGKMDLGYNAETTRGVIYNASGNSPCISINDVTIAEGDTGTSSAVFDVSLSSASAQTVQVSYTLDPGTATVGVDLQSVSGRLEIPAGQTTATISVPIIGDVSDEFDEQFRVNLTSPANAAITRGSGIGTIADNDAEPTIVISDVSANEGFFSQTFNFNVLLSAPSGKPISFRYTTANGTATAGTDYIAANNVLNITPGVSSVSAGVTVMGDSMHESNETFLVNLSEPTNVTFADGQGTGTIVNDDAVPTLTVNAAFGPEGDTGTSNVTVNLQLSNLTDVPVTLNVLTSDGTAIGNQDYVPSDTPVTIPAATQSFTTQVQIRGDVVNEPNETFFVNIYNITNATTTQPQSSILIIDDDSSQFDFDNDGKADVGIFRPTPGEWWYQRSVDSTVRALRFGDPADKIVPADFTGDGRTDIATWRPSTGQWFILRSENNTFYAVPFGVDGDIPAPGDYDNDGRADLAIFRPSSSIWYITPTTGGTRIEQFGANGDQPVVADYDGDGRSDVAIYRPTLGQWWISRSSGGVTALTFGGPDDKAVAGDYTGDGKADIAFWRPATGEWFVLRSEDFSYYALPFGTNGDVPAPADYDGDGRHDLTVFRPSNSTWYLQRSTAGILIQQFGASGDVPVASAFVR